MELVAKGASKLLNDCKIGNIVKELKKLIQQDTKQLEATNTISQMEMDELKMKLALKDDEIWELKGKKTEALYQIREMVENSSDALNKAQFFDK